MDKFIISIAYIHGYIKKGILHVVTPNPLSFLLPSLDLNQGPSD